MGMFEIPVTCMHAILSERDVNWICFIARSKETPCNAQGFPFVQLLYPNMNGRLTVISFSMLNYSDKHRPFVSTINHWSIEKVLTSYVRCTFFLCNRSGYACLIAQTDITIPLRGMSLFIEFNSLTNSHLCSVPSLNILMLRIVDLFTSSLADVCNLHLPRSWSDPHWLSKVSYLCSYFAWTWMAV